jgi:hypothetical protein
MSCGGSGGGGFGDGGAGAAGSGGSAGFGASGGSGGTGGSFAGSAGSGGSFAGGSAGIAGSAGAGGSAGIAGSAGSAGSAGAGGTTATGGAGGTGGTTTTGTCAATVAAGALPTTAGAAGMGGYQSTVGTGGYAFAFSSDTTTGTTTPCTSLATFCVDSTAVCAAGTTGVVNPPDYTCNGAGFGINIGQAMGSTVTGTYSVPATSTGITYTLSGPPPAGGMRIQVVTGTAIGTVATTYCATITGATGVVAWTSLELTCYDTPPGDPLTGPPTDLQNVQFTIDDSATATPYNICLNSVTF